MIHFSGVSPVPEAGDGGEVVGEEVVVGDEEVVGEEEVEEDEVEEDEEEEDDTDYDFVTRLDSSDSE